MHIEKYLIDAKGIYKESDGVKRYYTIEQVVVKLNDSLIKIDELEDEADDARMNAVHYAEVTNWD